MIRSRTLALVVGSLVMSCLFTTPGSAQQPIFLTVNSTTGAIFDTDPCPSPRNGKSYQTIKKALQCAQPNDIIDLQRGSEDHRESGISITKSIQIRGVASTPYTPLVGSSSPAIIFSVAKDVIVQISNLLIRGTATAGTMIVNQGTLTIADSKIESVSRTCCGIENGATGNMTIQVTTVRNFKNFGSGAAINNLGRMRLKIARVEDNEGDRGAAVTNSGTGILTIEETVFSGNQSHDQAGSAILNFGQLAMTNSTVSGNSNGAAVVSAGTASTDISFSTLSNNTGKSLGYSTSCGCTVYDSASSLYTSTSGKLRVRNSIIANNRGGNCKVDPGATFTVGGINLSTDNSCPGMEGVSTGALNLDSLKENPPGFGPTHALNPGSRAIDRIAVEECKNWAGAPTFQDGRYVDRLLSAEGQIFPREGSGCDVGAYEFQAVPRFKEDPPETIRIGVQLPLTGSGAAAGLDMWHGALLAAEQINAQGGILDPSQEKRLPVELFFGDTQSTVEGAVAAATQLVYVNNVVAVTGGFSTATTIEDREVMARAFVPYLISASSSPRLTREASDEEMSLEGIFLYREIGPNQGKAMAQYLAEVVRPKLASQRQLRVAVLYQDSSFGRDFVNGLPGLGIVGYSQSQSLPLEFVALETFAVGTTDFRAQLINIKNARPDVIVPIAQASEPVDLMRQGIAELGIEALWGPIASSADTPTFYKDLGALANFSSILTYFSTYETPPGEAGRNVGKFRSDFQERWGDAAGLQGAAMYDSLFLLKAAIEKSAADKFSITSALAELDMPQLVLPVEGGRIHFENREARFRQFATQLFFDPSIGETRPVIVWPQDLAKGTFDASIGAVADIAVGITAPASAAAGARVTFTIEVVNRGSDAAQNVVLAGATPSWSRMVCVATDRGTCTATAAGGTGDISCTLGSLAAAGKTGDRAAIQLVVQLSDTATLQQGGQWTSWSPGISARADFRVHSSTSDSNTGNNAAHASVRITR